MDAPSDLVPGVYEGGLKTWECAVDLADCLDRLLGGESAARIRGKRVLELGCGTAVPSLFLLHQLFTSELPEQMGSQASEVHVHLQDYNALVLRLVTLPNILLAWYMSPASLALRTSADADVEADAEPLPPADPTTPGTLPITPELTAAFLAALRAYGVRLRFFAGAWEGFELPHAYDVVLTSETIYRPDSLPALVHTMRSACLGVGLSSTADGNHGEKQAADGLARLELGEGHAPVFPLCLVAAKRVYFGVGGGVTEFVRAVEGKHGGVETVWERADGVKRVVLRVRWS